MIQGRKDGTLTPIIDVCVLLRFWHLSILLGHKPFKVFTTATSKWAGCFDGDTIGILLTLIWVIVRKVTTAVTSAARNRCLVCEIWAIWH